MSGPKKLLAQEFDSLVESHLNLQVKISYSDHHDFLLRHHITECSQILDVGTGNGTFVARLAHDHPEIHFVGIDKRKPIIESSKKLERVNLKMELVDMFARVSSFDFTRFDGFLMRYFLLHVDHSQKILELLQARAKKSSKLWIIDLDWSQFRCEPAHEGFDLLTKLVKEFCAKVSHGSMGGERVVSLLETLKFENIIVENIPFSTLNVPLEELVLYLKQEVLCYSLMSGRSADDPEALKIMRFLDEELRSQKYEVSYAMVLIAAEVAHPAVAE